MPGLGTPSKRYEACKARCCLFGVCEALKDFTKVHSVSRDNLFYGKATGKLWVGPQVWWVRVSENHQNGVNRFSQVDGDLHMGQPAGSMVGVHSKGTALLSWIKLSLQCSPQNRQFSCSFYVPGTPFELLP